VAAQLAASQEGLSSLSKYIFTYIYIYIYIYKNDVPHTPGVCPGPFADDMCIYTYIYGTDRKEGYVLRKLQQGLSAVETWCEQWNIKINEDKSQAIYFSSYRPEAHLTLSGRNIPFVSHVKCYVVIFNKRIQWRLRIVVIEAMAFKKFISIYSLSKNKRFNANIKLTIHKALIISMFMLALSGN
jgi:hypothetical protein